MRLLLPLLLAGIGLGGCQSGKDHVVQVIVGATLISPPVSYSIVVVKDGRIDAAGPQASVPVPRDSVKVNGLGKFLVAEAEGQAVEAGKPADLLLLSGDPRVDPSLREKAERRMKAGKWIE